MMTWLPSNARRTLAGLKKFSPFVELDIEGRILSASERFCEILGYSLTELQGKHYSALNHPQQDKALVTAEIWADILRGKSRSEPLWQCRKNGEGVWLEALFVPLGDEGRPRRILQFVTDVTASKSRSDDNAGKVDALHRSQAVIEFDTNGKILGANANFLEVIGYQLDEITGRHHSMFCEPDYVQSDAYGRFWSELRAGTFQSDEFLRKAKGGRDVFIQATYNPVRDHNGCVVKVVKFATDVTSRVRDVKILGVVIDRLAKGDLCAEIDEPFIPSLEALRTDFNAAGSKLRLTMSEIGASAQQIAASSDEIRIATDGIAKRTENQASSLEETAAALEQITAQADLSSRRANEVGQLVRVARSNAVKSGDLVDRAKSAMDSISESSNGISSIIGVIDSIAFQTNLLALNAGVEAARAGEAGKGFAVVAQEVRELAQRSSKAAHEIKQLILTANAQVSEGVKLVSETGAALTQISREVGEIDVHVSAIVTSSNEQSAGISEINNAMTTIDHQTQQNAAMIEESTAACHSLATDAARLLQLIRQFKIERHQGRQPMRLVSGNRS